jgi:hypothetical protein
VVADRTVTVSLKADVLSYKASMSSAAASTAKLSTAQAAAEKKMVASNARITKSAALASRAGNVMMVAGAAALVVSAKNASTMEEALSKSNNVFKEQAGIVESWSKTMANSFGISQQAALAAASQQGDMWQQMGLSADESARLSTNIVELTSDLGSYHDLGAEEVQLKLNAAYRGEFESIKSILPGIRMKRVQEEALIMTGKKSVDQLTQGEKALATHKLVLEDSADAQGDFARTSDSAANSTKKAKAALTDASASLGESLLPTIVTVTEALSGMAGWFKDLTKTQQVWAAAGVLGTAMLLKMAPQIAARIVATRLERAAVNRSTAATVANTAALSANSAAAGTNATAKGGVAAANNNVGKAAAGSGVAAAGGGAGWMKFAKGAGLAGTAILAGGYAINELMFSQRESIAVSEDANAAIEESGGVLNDRTRSVADAIIAENELGGQFRSSGVSMDTQRLAALGNKDAIAQVTHGYREATGAAKGSNTAFTSSGAALSDFTGQMANFEEQSRDAWEPIEALKREAEEGLAPALEEVKRQFALGGVSAMSYGRELVKMGKDAGKSTEEIRAMLVAAGVPPKKITLLVDIAPAQEKLDEASRL